MPPNPSILCGPIGSGKTSFLADWSARRPGTAGILSPHSAAGRVLVDIASGAVERFEAAPEDERVVAVGRFRFRSGAFAWANARLGGAAADAAGPVIIIDEIGPLEVAGGGFAPGLRAALRRPAGDLVIVVRDGLVDTVVQAFALSGARLLPPDQWPQLSQGSRSAP